MKNTIAIFLSIISIQLYAQNNKKYTPKKPIQNELSIKVKHKLVVNLNNYSIPESEGLATLLPWTFLSYLRGEPDYENNVYWANRKLLIADTKKVYFDALLKSLYQLSKQYMSFETYLVTGVYMSEQEALLLSKYLKKITETEEKSKINKKPDE